MDKHTLGPWSFYTEPQPNGCPIVGSRGLMVCMLAHTVNQPEQRTEAIANARLIAAAPELLGALKALLSLDADHQRGADDKDVCLEVQMARAAITKAEGVTP